MAMARHSIDMEMKMIWHVKGMEMLWHGNGMEIGSNDME
jgi:hypothetical protein